VCPPPATGYLALTFGTLLSSQGADAHRSGPFDPSRGNPFNLAAGLGSVKVTTRRPDPTAYHGTVFSSRPGRHWKGLGPRTGRSRVRCSVGQSGTLGAGPPGVKLVASLVNAASPGGIPAGWRPSRNRTIRTDARGCGGRRRASAASGWGAGDAGAEAHAGSAGSVAFVTRAGRSAHRCHV